MILKKSIQIVKKDNIKLIEIFDAVTGSTLFYIRLIPYMKFIEIYMKRTYPEITNYDYEIVS